MTDETNGSGAGEREHHPDCPALYFRDHPERCRCVFMAMLDRRPATPDADDASEPCDHATTEFVNDVAGWCCSHCGASVDPDAGTTRKHSKADLSSSGECRCRIVGSSRDPYEPHIPAQAVWEQADDCPVHPLPATPDVGDASEDQPPGFPGYDASWLPPAAAAAERVLAFVSWFGDGELFGGEVPLFARDLEAIARESAAATRARAEEREAPIVLDGLLRRWETTPALRKGSAAAEVRRTLGEHLTRAVGDA